MSWRRAVAARGLPVVAALGGLSSAVPAAEVYRCDINGVKTFVDSQARCPTAATAVSRAPAALPAKASAASAPTTGNATACAKLAGDAVRLSACLRDTAKAQARAIAVPRFDALRRALVTFLERPTVRPVVLAVERKGRPAPWCEEVLADIATNRNIDVLDDEERRRARWIDTVDSAGRSLEQPAALIDARYRTWHIDGAEVPDGYVHLLWRGDIPLMLSLPAACTDGSGKGVQCLPQRYPFVSLMDVDTPNACSVTLIDVSVWDTWKASKIKIHPFLGGR